MSTSAVSLALDGLRLDGAIFLRGEYTEAWAYESPTGTMMAGVLRPGRERLLYFHIIAAGRCWVSVDQGERHWAEQGDVVVLPYGHQHRMGGSSDATCVPVLELMSPPPWTEFPVIRHGHGGARTDVICGYLDVEDPLFDPALAALPAIFVVRPTGAARTWVESSLRYVLEATEGGTSDGEILTRLPAIVLAEVLRLHIASTPASAEGLGHLRRLGLQAINLQAIAGTDVGVIATSVNHASNADYAAAMQKVLADEQWQEFWMRVNSDTAAVEVESSLFVDIDPTFQPSADRALGVLLGTQWRARPGRLMDFMGNVMTAIPHIERMGGQVRVMQSLIGLHPLTVLVTTAFTDLDAYGVYADQTATDEQWQSYWMGVMADPTADLIRSGLFMNISDG